MIHRIIFIALTCITLLSCNHKNWNVDYDYVQLKARISDTAKIIHLGDTLKISLVVPDIVTTSLNQKIAVNSMQESWYGFHCSRLDTITKTDVSLVLYPNALSVTDGGRLSSYGGIYLSTSGKPFRATLNIIPPVKGVYYIQNDAQPGYFRVNKDYVGGLFVNFDVADKHWGVIDTYFPGFATSGAYSNSIGVGCYCFRVE